MNKEGLIKIGKRMTKSQVFWPLVVLFLVLLSNVFTDAGFFKIEIKDGHLFGSIIDILKNGAPLMIIAIGMTLVIATGGIDISVGSTVAIAGAVAASLIGGENASKVPYGFVLLITIFVCIALGVWNGLLVSKIGIQAVVATLILMVAGRGIAQLITNGQILTVYYEPFFYLGSGYFLGFPFAIFLVILVLVIAMFLVKKTAFGLFLQSTGVNSSSSRLSGVNVKAVIFFVYVFCAVCAGIAGLVLSSNVKCADSNNAGLFIELDAILAVALGGNSLKGGKFNIAGSIIGALIIQSLTTTIYAMGISPNITFVVKAVVVVVICMVQSDALRSGILNAINKRREREV